MPFCQPSNYFEKIQHQTESRSFSLHHTIVHPGLTSVLYPHWHSEMEILYMEHGDAIFQIEDQVFQLKKGDAIFIPPNLLHRADRMDDLMKECSFYAVVFASEMILNYSFANHKYYLQPVLYNAINCILPIYAANRWQCRILEHINKILSDSHGKIESYELMLRGELLLIWQLMYNHHMSHIQMTDSYNRLYPRLKDSIDFISDNYTQSLSLQELSHNAGLSQGYFCRLFKEFTGVSPFRFINRKRIAKSCEYLIGTNKKIAEIATLCGYNNISYYNRTFQQLMKDSPSTYRKHYAGHSNK